jgi:Mn2+/Fe2+ NRAMP family transporter
MGEYKNNRAFNIIAWTTCVVILVLTLVYAVSTFFPAELPFH